MALQVASLNSDYNYGPSDPLQIQGGTDFYRVGNSGGNATGYYLDTGYSSGGRSGGGGGGGAASPNPNDVAFLDSQSANLRRMLQSADAGLNNGLTALTDSYNKEVSGANQQRSRALEDYAKQGVINEQDKITNLNTIDSNARSLNNSLRRIIGMASGSSSSAFQDAAPNAVARQASGQRDGALSSFGRNSEALSTAETRAKQDFDALLENLAAQRRQKESDLRGSVLNQKNDIQAKLADIAANRAQVLGGGTSQILAARAPYQNAINANQNALDGLFAQFRSPTYDIKPVDVKPVDLAKYIVDRAALNTNAQTGTQSAYSPYNYFLNKDKQDQTNPVTGA